MESGVEGAGIWPQRSELRASLADGGAGLSFYPLRPDHGMAPTTFEPAGLPDAESARPLSRARVVAALAGMLGVVVGVLLSMLLAHTAFAPASQCRTDDHGASTCARVAR